MSMTPCLTPCPTPCRATCRASTRMSWQCLTMLLLCSIYWPPSTSLLRPRPSFIDILAAAQFLPFRYNPRRCSLTLFPSTNLSTRHLSHSFSTLVADQLTFILLSHLLGIHHLSRFMYNLIEKFHLNATVSLDNSASTLVLNFI